MAKRTVNIGSTANDGTGDQLRTAFDKLNQNNDEIYGANFVTEAMLNDNIVGADELKVTGDGAAGQILTSDGDGSMSWTTGVTGDITGVEAGDGLTGGGTGGDVTLNVVAGTGITVTADEVALATTVQDEITLNTAKTGFPGFGTTAGTSLEGDTALLQVGTLATEALAGNTTTITTAQANEITANTAKVSDQTVTLTEGANVTITGTYPSFTIASDDVVGAVNSVNGDTGVVVLATVDIAEDTNLYYTEARVSANTDVAANTAKTGITSGQAGEITANTAKVGITTAQAGEITDNTAKVSNITTNLSITGTTDARTIVSSDGTDAIIPVASTTESGLMSKAIFDEHEVNNAKAAGTATNLTKTVSGTGFSINSSDGTNVDLSLADTDNWGLMSDEMFDAQVLNTAKLTNADHDGEVTGSGTLTIADGAVVADRLATDAVTTDKILNEAVTHDKLSTRFTHQTAVSTLTGVVDYDCSEASSFKLSGDLTGAYTINLTNYKQGQVITVYPLKAQGVTLTAGTGTEVFNKLSEMDYDNTKSNILQIECVDDQAANPVFFYSVASFAADATI